MPETPRTPQRIVTATVVCARAASLQDIPIPSKKDITWQVDSAYVNNDLVSLLKAIAPLQRFQLFPSTWTLRRPGDVLMGEKLPFDGWFQGAEHGSDAP
jgi:hypothetical protein